jgi:hypothetical protein
MPLLDQAAKLATRKMPKVITPKAHAMIDYAVAASFFAVGAFLWRRNKRAAIGALACGAAETVTALCTDYPGGVTKQLSLETHRTLDFTMSGVITSIPGMLHFADQPEAHFFRAQGLVIVAVAGLTDFSGDGLSKLDKTLDRRSA